MIITKDTLIADILKNINGAKELFENETLEKGCLMHGLNIEEIMDKIKNLQNI